MSGNANMIKTHGNKYMCVLDAFDLPFELLFPRFIRT